jgi:succinyl-CoA synthetase beta subunit
MHSVSVHASNAYGSAIDGILVSPMRPAGIELLVGIIHDVAWGQALVVGLGGIWTEVLNDTTVRVLPIKHDEIEHMLSELRTASLLRGVRGQPPVNMERLVDIIFRISRVAQGLQDRLDTLEINPLLLHGSSIEALDVLMTWKR